MELTRSPGLKESVDTPVPSKKTLHRQTFSIVKPTIVIDKRPAVLFSPKPRFELDAAATKLQKVYKSYRTRRNLADCAVVVEELWWKTLENASLKRLSISFFDTNKKETATSKWTRATSRLAKVGKGLSKDGKAQKLALRHWLEAIDPRHRYGHNLHLYYNVWFDSRSTQPFFYWLDVGDGKDVNHEKCSRADLQRQCISYLCPKEREAYEVIVECGKLIYRQDNRLLNTIDGSKWIFVLSTSKTLYVGQKKKGSFQHSSFLAGAAITAAGRLVARDGVLEAIWPYSGHYLPTDDNFKEFISFLEENNLDLTNVKKRATDDDDYSSKPSTAESLSIRVADVVTIAAANAKVELDMSSRSPMAKFNGSNRLSCKWTSGVGPRIGCVRDYPAELQSMALGQVSLSSGAPNIGSWPIPSPRPSPKIMVSPKLAFMGLPSPRVHAKTASVRH